MVSDCVFSMWNLFYSSSYLHAIGVPKLALVEGQSVMDIGAGGQYGGKVLEGWGVRNLPCPLFQPGQESWTRVATHLYVAGAHREQSIFFTRLSQREESIQLLHHVSTELHEDSRDISVKQMTKNV